MNKEPQPQHYVPIELRDIARAMAARVNEIRARRSQMTDAQAMHEGVGPVEDGETVSDQAEQSELAHS